MKRLETSPSEMTPLVDVTLLILIFFMITASFAPGKGLEFPARENDSTGRAVQNDASRVARLTVDPDGTFFLAAVDWQRALSGKQDLIKHLKHLKSEYREQIELQIAVDPRARLQRLVDAVDAAALAGFERTELSTLTPELI
ncbi:biopolymer transporter ExbD [Roseiconus nitratireducens]|uniref:Biopolymer transporter ExbD n=1 Tax=Roseiconus nitratireducens TaxID=2605748 RepID=A0A5M6D338_9BACT|nr:biopolymer transporter ExbD [Roseiconus nitratireducens]KAA5541000.1 biopolymer transporter ExbD [Roseiconus nitratireducens]